MSTPYNLARKISFSSENPLRSDKEEALNHTVTKGVSNVEIGECDYGVGKKGVQKVGGDEGSNENEQEEENDTLRRKEGNHPSSMVIPTAMLETIVATQCNLNKLMEKNTRGR